MNPDQEINLSEEEPAITHSLAWVCLYGDEEDRKRWREESHRHTEWLIETEARRYMRERFCTDIEEARRDAREAMWPFA